MRAAGVLIGFIGCGTLPASGLIVEESQDRDIHLHDQASVLKHATAESLLAKSSIMYDAFGNKYDKNGVVGMGLGMFARMAPPKSKATSMASEKQVETKVGCPKKKKGKGCKKKKAKASPCCEEEDPCSTPCTKTTSTMGMPGMGMPGMGMPGMGMGMGMPGMPGMNMMRMGMMPGMSNMMNMQQGMMGMPGGYFPPSGYGASMMHPAMMHPGNLHPNFIQPGMMNPLVMGMMGGGSGGVMMKSGGGGCGCKKKPCETQGSPCEQAQPCQQVDPPRDAPSCGKACTGSTLLGFGSTGLAEGYRSGYFAGRGCSDNPSYRDSHGYNCWGWEGYDCSGSTMFQGYGPQEYVQMRMLCPKTCGLC